MKKFDGVIGGYDGAIGGGKASGAIGGQYKGYWWNG